MPEINYVIPQGSLILVTGANGYIASHVINILLEEGFNVRGSVRSQKPWLNKYFHEQYGNGQFETVLVPALDTPGAWSQVMKDVVGVLHIASDVDYTAKPEILIPRVKRGMINILEAAANEKSVKRFVLTSSSCAALIPVPDKEGVRVDKNTWNEASVKAAWDESTPAKDRGYHVYAASKTVQEQEAWKWVKENQPGFVFNTIVPNTNYGKILLPEIPGSTMLFLRNVLKGDDWVMRQFPPQWFVNVEDTARLHVAALLSPNVKDERIFAFASSFNWNDIIGILRKLRPGNKLIPNPPANDGRDLSDIVLAPRAEQLLRDLFGQNSWIGLEESIADGIEGCE